MYSYACYRGFFDMHHICNLPHNNLLFQVSTSLFTYHSVQFQIENKYEIFEIYCVTWKQSRNNTHNETTQHNKHFVRNIDVCAIFPVTLAYHFDSRKLLPEQRPGCRNAAALDKLFFNYTWIYEALTSQAGWARPPVDAKSNIDSRLNRSSNMIYESSGKFLSSPILWGRTDYKRTIMFTLTIWSVISKLIITKYGYSLFPIAVRFDWQQRCTDSRQISERYN